LETFIVFKVSILIFAANMKDSILQKAVDMFLSYGFKSVTMDDIANEMGVSKKTLYKYFSNKERLVDETTLVVQEKIDSIIKEIMSAGYNAIEENFVIKNVFKEMFKKAKTSPMYQLKKYYPDTYNKLMEVELCTFSECITSNLEKGIKEKVYRKDIDKDMVMRFYFILVFGAHESDLFSSNMSDMLQIELKILEYHTRAIATLNGISVLEKQLTQINQTAS
jgi:AcrR family transcriptional regulator